jgi:hypothetical protein
MPPVRQRFMRMVVVNRALPRATREDNELRHLASHLNNQRSHPMFQFQREEANHPMSVVSLALKVRSGNHATIFLATDDADMPHAWVWL